MAEIIKVTKLNKEIRFFTSVRDVSFSVEEGTVLSLIGPEHSGKSLLIQMLSGVTIPDSGTVEISKIDGREPRIGVVYDLPSFPGNMSVKNTLKYRQLMMGVPTSDAEIESLLNMTGLSRVSMLRVKKLRGDQLFRFALCYALVGEPDILLLDEPLRMIDHDNRNSVLKLIADQNRFFHRTIVITGKSEREYQSFANAVCDISSGAVRSTTRTFTDTEPVYTNHPVDLGTDDVISAPKREQNMALNKSSVGHIEFTMSPLSDAKKVLDEMEIFSYQTKGPELLFVMEQIYRKDEMIDKFKEAGVDVKSTIVVLESLSE